MGIGSQEAGAASPCMHPLVSEGSDPLRARDGRLSAGARIGGA